MGDSVKNDAAAPDDSASSLDKVISKYDFRMTPYLRRLLHGRDDEDPIAIQFLPDVRELNHRAHEAIDPIGDDRFSPVKGIVHRYPDRVLLKASHACPVYCRFCFRREMVGSNGDALTVNQLDSALDYIRSNANIWEVILTGGDPLVLSNRRLKRILDELADIEHVNLVRLHSRVPIVNPERIDAGCIDTLNQRFPVYFAVHVNHPDELTEEAETSLRRLSKAGVILLSQTVLLAGVNDDATVLETLFRRLVRIKVRPYYLHHPDLAPGTSHFRVPIETGQAIMRRLRGRLSGLCQPTYVLDLPGGFGKVPIGPSYLAETAAGDPRTILDWRGQRHDYPE